MARDFTLLQLSDPHLGATWGGDEPLARLRAAVAAVRALPDRPDAVLVSGDVTDDGDPASYEAARSTLEELGLPLFVLPGNHDARAPMRAAFGLAGAAEDRIDYAVELGPLRLVVLDSTVPGLVPGSFPAEALAWLDVELAAAPQQPTLLALHHPPLATGLPTWDAINLSAGDIQALGEVVGRHPQLRVIVGGHLHAAMSGVLAGRPVLAVPSTYEQSAPGFGAEAEPHFVPYPPYPPGFAVHILREGRLGSRVVSYAP